MNSLRVIEPYLKGTTWVFDDPAVGLQAEPFVAGIPEIIDHVLREKGFEEAPKTIYCTIGE